MSEQAGEARRSDAGESLVELLVSIAILGIAVIAVLGALTMGSSASSLHKGQAKNQNLLHNWAEKVSASTYTACATTAQIVASDTLPTGYSSSVTNVQYWNGTAFGSSCAAATDKGLQRVTLKITAPSSANSIAQSLDVIVRKPCESGC